MSLIRRERRPVWPPETVWSQDLVDSAFSDMFGTLVGGETQVMRVEEYLEDGTCVIRAELPGIDPDKDVEITVADGVVHLRAEREERSDEKRPDGYRSEFRYGRLSRSIRLPQGADETDVTASYEDGILEIRVPAPGPETAPAPTRIPISRG